MKVLYTSPIFKHVDGRARQFMIPAEAVKTYLQRDNALLVMTHLGGIHAEPTVEFLKLRKKMLAAKRKIQREGWFSKEIV
jgi:hypothetical protein